MDLFCIYVPCLFLDYVIYFSLKYVSLKGAWKLLMRWRVCLLDLRAWKERVLTRWLCVTTLHPASVRRLAWWWLPLSISTRQRLYTVHETRPSCPTSQHCFPSLPSRSLLTLSSGTVQPATPLWTLLSVFQNWTIVGSLVSVWFIGPIPWGHSGPLSLVVVAVVVVNVVVDIDAQAACDSGRVRQ